MHFDPEFDIAPDVEYVPRLWCDECHRKTAYRYDAFGMPVCLECSEPRFEHTYCSQCGLDLGPGDAGVSHCIDHRRIDS